VNRALSRLFRGIAALARDLEDAGAEATVTASVSFSLRDLGIDAIPGDEEPRLDYTTGFDVLDKVAADVVGDPGRGGFLRSFADAWLQADAESKEILRPAWISIIERHSLSEATVTPEQRQAIHDFVKEMMK
jgi:hypothetical protein